MAIIKNFSIALTANIITTVSYVGTVVRCTSASAAFTVQPQNFDEIELQEGIGIQFPESLFASGQITKFRFLSATTQTVVVYIGDGDIVDNRQYGSVDATIQSAGTLSTVADVTAVGSATTQIVSASSTRKNILITNLSTTNTLRIGDSNAGATRGMALAPGLTLTLTYYDGDVYAYNPGSSSDVGITFVND